MGLWDKLFNKTPVLKGYVSEEHYPMYENAKGETVEMSPEQYQRVQGENVPNDVATTYGIATLPFATMSAPIGVGSALGNAVLNSAFGGGVYGGINGAINSINNGENPLLGTAKGFGEGALVGGAFGVPAHYTGELLNYGAKKALPYIRNVRNGGGLFDRLASETGFDIANPLHRQQANLINKYNPAPDTYHTWVRNADDIHTFEDTLKAPVFDEDFIGNNFDDSYSWDMAQDAIKNGYINVYSSYPIEKGTFVTPSQMEAQAYSGNGKIYSKQVPLEDVAWIEATQGQYAPINKINQKNNLYDKLTNSRQ